MNQRISSSAISTVVIFTLLAFLFLIGGNVSAQTTTKNSDGSTTTKEGADFSSGRGRTKETTRDKDGNITKVEIKNDKGNIVEREEYGANGIIRIWRYDRLGRVIVFVMSWTHGGPFGDKGAIGREIKYKDDQDTTGNADDYTHTGVGDEPRRRANDNESTFIGLAIKPDPLATPKSESSTGPGKEQPTINVESIIGDLFPAVKKKPSEPEAPKGNTVGPEAPNQSAPTMIPAALGIAPNGQPVGAKGRPILILTENGQSSGIIIGPKGATDVHVFWGSVFVPEGGGYGYWTMNGKEIPKSKFTFLGNINDIHFSPTGRVPRLAPIPAPPGANDVEIEWDENGYITEAGWTHDGQFLAQIPVPGDRQELSLKFNPQEGRRLQGSSSTQLVGIVYDKNTRQGEPATMSVTNDPKKYENIPGLGVALMNVNALRNANGRASLDGIVVNFENGRQQSANQPFTLQLAQKAASMAISLSNPNTQTALGQANVPIPSLSQGTPVAAISNTGSPANFTTQPVVQDTSFIRGPFSNNGNIPRITLDNQPVSIIAGSGSTVYFDLPAGVSAGAHRLTVRDGANSASFPVVKMSVTGQIVQPSLQRGQKTNYSVTVNMGQLPDTVWQRGGASPELSNPSQIHAMAPGFKIPKAGGPASVLLAINNASRDTVSIKPSKDERVIFDLHQQDFQNNQFTTRGEIQSKVSGTFTLDLLAQAFFGEIPGEIGDPAGPTSPNGEDVECAKLDCNPPVNAKPPQDETGLWIKCNSCATCAPSPCGCQLWRQKLPTKDDPVPPKEKVADQNKPGKKEAGYNYFCQCH